MSTVANGERSTPSDVEQPESLQEVVKWFFARPSGYWTPAWGLFFVSWSLMTQLPFALFWGNTKIGNRPVFEADPNTYWGVFLTFEVGWLVVSNFLVATFLHAARLSSRIERLEQQLQVVRREKTAAAAGPTS